MDVNRLNKLYEITNGIKTRLRSSYLEKHNSELHNEIISFCSLIDVPYIQKIWHWVNDEPDHIKCYCGNIITFNRNWLNGYKKYCSSICAQNSNETKLKKKVNYLNKYGVDHHTKTDKCKIKTKNTNLLKYGVDHHSKTVESKEKTSKTNLEKYGVCSYSKTDEYKLKVKNTNLINHGVDHHSKSDEYKSRIKDNNILKYGVDNYAKTDESKNKVKNTNLLKYGVDNYSKTDESKNKVKNTNLLKYGVDNYAKTDESKNKSKSTNINKYGIDVYSKTDECKQKMYDTNIERYDAKFYTKSDKYKNTIYYRNLNYSIERFGNLGFDYIGRDINRVSLLSRKCGHEFDINITTFISRNQSIINCCLICNPPNTGQSNGEIELIEWLKDLSIIVNVKNRDICSPQEIDIFLPEYNLSIEFNGIYWHSEIYKDKNYHINKTNMCNGKGISLIHVWEDDWVNKKDIVKSIILNRIKKIERKVHTRKCILKIVPHKEKRDFLIINHIQGDCNSTINLGLYINDELISLMTLGWRKINKKREFELLRFCNKLNTLVTGAASKIFKHFLNNYNFDSITSYADISMFTGELYPNLGFEYSHRSALNYWWVVDRIRRHRFNFNKQSLVKKGYDKSLTGDQIMNSLGYYKIWGCGQDKYIYNKNGEN
jgi:hypothetical protein